MQSDNIMLNRRILFDGGMGTQLTARGLTGSCPEMHLVTDFDKVAAIHADYAAAGSTVVTTNTFGANPIKLRKHGLESRAAELNALGVRAAKQGAAGRALVALDMGPTGELMEPFGTLTYDAAYAAFRLQADVAREEGADLVIIETMASLMEAKIAALAAHDAGMPFVLSFTFEQNGRTLMGNTPAACAVVAGALGASMLATNCSGGPEHMLPIIKTYHEYSALPIMAQPNAGLPQVVDGCTVFPYGAQDMAEPVRALIEAGACAIGGCCGTTPTHIAEFGKLAFGPTEREAMPAMLCSERDVVRVDELSDLPELPMDEAEDFDGDEDALIVDLTGCDADDALESLSTLTTMVHVPLIFKGGDEDTMRAVLRAYPGAAGVIGFDALAGECGAVAVSF